MVLMRDILGEVQVGDRGLLSESLARRDILQRFDPEEKVELAALLRSVWEGVDFRRNEAPIISLQDGYFKWGIYPDDEVKVLSTPEGRALAKDTEGEDLYALVNLETLLDMFVAMGVLTSRLKPEKVTLGTMYLPYQGLLRFLFL